MISKNRRKKKEHKRGKQKYTIKSFREEKIYRNNLDE